MPTPREPAVDIDAELRALLETETRRYLCEQAPDADAGDDPEV